MTEKIHISVVKRLLWITNTLYHQALAVVAIFILWTIFNNYQVNSLFTWHMGLSTIAYIPLMAEAIILFSGDNLWSLHIDRSIKYYYHGIMLFISAILATIGISFMIYEKDSHHFRSVHALNGVASWILVLLSQCLGLLSANSTRFSSICPPVWLKFIHNLFGIFGFLLGVISLIYGIEKHAFKVFTSHSARITATIILGFVIFWTILEAIRSLIQQFKKICN